MDVRITALEEQGSSGDGTDCLRNIKPGGDLSNCYLVLNVFPDVDLNGANISGADLRKAELANANLEGSNLSGANLDDAILSGANLKDANLSGAKMNVFTNVFQSDFSNVDFSNAILTDGVFGVAFIQVNLDGVNFSGANLEGVDFFSAINQPTGNIDCIGTPFGATFTCTG